MKSAAKKYCQLEPFGFRIGPALIPLNMLSRISLRAAAAATALALTTGLVPMQTALAAAGLVTNTAPAMTVGTNVPAFSITVDIATAADITDGENLTFTLPGNLPDFAATSAADADDGLISYSLSIGGGAAGAGCSATAAGNVLTVAFTTVATCATGDAAIQDGDDVVLSFSTAADVTTPAAPLYAGTVDVDTSGAGNIVLATTSDVVLNATGASAITVSAADAAATVVRSTATTGDHDLTLTFTTPRALTTGETINVTLPASFTVANGTDVLAGGITNNQNSSTLTTSAAGQVLILTVAGATLTDSNGGASTHVVTIDGDNAIAAYVDTTDITTFSIETATADDIALDSAVALTDVTAADAAATVTKASQAVVSSQTDVTVAFTLPAALPTTAWVNITFPSFYTVSATSTAIVAGSITGACQPGAATMTLSEPSENVARLTVGGANLNAGACSVVIPGANIVPNNSGSTDITSFVIERATGEDVATDSTVALTDAIKTSGGGGSSSVVADTTAPAKATNLKATVTTDNKISLTWTNSTDSDVSLVEVLKGGVALASLAKGTASYTDSAVTAGQTVSYQIRTRDTSSNTSLSDEITIKVEQGATQTVEESQPETPAEEETPVSEEETPTEESAENTTDELAEMAGVTSDEIQATADAYSDVAVTDWFAAFIARAQKDGIMTGDAGAIRPNDAANRAELAKIAATAFGKATVEGSPFSDVPADAWFAPFVGAVKAAGIKGYSDGTFRPAAQVNRAEALAMLLTVAGVDFASTDVSGLAFSDVAATDWFAPAVAWASANGIVSGKTATTFEPGASITRAEIAKITVMLKLKLEAAAEEE